MNIFYVYMAIFRDESGRSGTWFVNHEENANLTQNAAERLRFVNYVRNRSLTKKYFQTGENDQFVLAFVRKDDFSWKVFFPDQMRVFNQKIKSSFVIGKHRIPPKKCFDPSEKQLLQNWRAEKLPVLAGRLVKGLVEKSAHPYSHIGIFSLLILCYISSWVSTSVCLFLLDSSVFGSKFGPISVQNRAKS